MNQIKYLKQNQIDKLLWDKCISTSANSRIYAYSWFLDCMTENWDALIVGDYEIVMPLPWKSKYGFKYIYHPPFIQQLGVFSSGQTPNIFEFIAAIPKHFIKIDYFFSSNHFDMRWEKYAKTKQNFVLNLNQPLSEIEKNYKDSLKRNLKSARNNGCKISKLGIENIPLVIDMYRNAYEQFYTHFDDDVFKRIKNMLEWSFNIGSATIHAIQLPDNNIVATYITLKDNNRVYYLFGAPNNEGKQSKSIPFLINEIIKEFAESHLLFDFEGSEIPSVASFYQKFNPQVEHYYQVKYFNLLGFKFKTQ